MKDKIVFSIDSLYKSYDKKRVLEGVSLQVEAGEIFGFIGKNGVGKSTTIDCSIGIKKFDSGTIQICGYDPIRQPLEAKRCLGYVASTPCCYDNMTGFSYLQFLASIYGVEKQDFTERLDGLLDCLYFDRSDLRMHISTYSHGKRQKICLIGSLLHDPDLWLLDEPTVGLDVMTIKSLKLLMQERASRGKTVFFASHNIEFVASVCDRVAIINEGTIVALYDLNADPQLKPQLSQLFYNLNENNDN